MIAVQPITSASVPTPVVELCEEIRRSGYVAWIVGGCVRDLMLAREVHDWDIATTARPAQVRKVFARVVPTGLQHGTVTVLWQEDTYEVTTLRGEGGYSDGRRPDEVFFVDRIEEDLARRDFTVNAMAFDPIDGQLVDPFDGAGDLARRVLRAVGDPALRFAEDGLRVLRAARFAATLEMQIEPATLEAIEPSLEVYAKVSKERIRDEWQKALLAPKPSVAFEIMRSTGMLRVTCPELLEQVDCEQNRFHAHDVWTHTMACTDAAAPSLVLRLASLLHDLGKPRTRQHSEKTDDFTFYHHEKVGAQMADRWLHDHRFSNAERQATVHLIRHHLVCYSSDWTDAAVRRFLRRVGPEHVDALVGLARADALAKGRPVDEELALLDELTGRVALVLEAGAALKTKDLAINGKDIMEALGIEPSRRIGELLEALLERVTEEPALNERERLLSLLTEIHGASA